MVSICVKGYMCFYNRTVGKKIQSETMKATAMDSMSDSIATTAVLIGAIIYKACVAAALKFFEPQDMKLITAVLFLVILIVGMERKKKVKGNA